MIKSPTGDGMALVFRRSAEESVECALEISRALKTHPNLPLRMGVHSGPVSGVVDVNDTTSVAGAAINMCQRVMDCGDAGHILVSKHVAEDLEQSIRVFRNSSPRPRLMTQSRNPNSATKSVSVAVSSLGSRLARHWVLLAMALLKV